MREIIGDIWEYHKLGSPIVITTNGYVKQSGAAVMGRGVALEAARRYPEIQGHLGACIREYGNVPFYMSSWKILTLPVKHHWAEPADIDLILHSLRLLEAQVQFRLTARDRPIYMVRPGCGNGQLNWEKTVKPRIAPLLNDDYVIVERHANQRVH